MPVRTFSTLFPKTHIRAGQPTFFVEKILSGIKIHTIRAGHSWKDGDMLDPRSWTDRPYASPQKKIKEPFPCGAQDIFIRWSPSSVWIFIDGKYNINMTTLLLISSNDGLTTKDFVDWFGIYKGYGTFSGQILHFTDLRY